MNLSLRHRCYVWMMVFMVGCFLLNFAIDILHDLRMGEGLENKMEELQEFAFIGLGNLLVMPIVLSAGWFVVRGMLKPINTAALTARRISDGRLQERVPVPVAQDELRMLIESMNLAFDRYDESLAQLRRFSANAAHQLRSPLTAIRAMGEVCLSRERTSGEYREMMQSMLERLDQLSHMTEQILSLAEIGHGDWKTQFSPVDLAEVVDQVCADYEPLGSEGAINFVNQVDPGTIVQGDRTLLFQMLANILDNAIRFTPAQGRVVFSTGTARDGYVQLRVDDSGPGIPEELRTMVFDRFEQGLQSDTRGSGLGLAIVAEIARTHYAAVRAEASALGGACIVVEFPLT